MKNSIEAFFFVDLETNPIIRKVFLTKRFSAQTTKNLKIKRKARKYINSLEKYWVLGKCIIYT